jgi:hypothetical protein
MRPPVWTCQNPVIVRATARWIVGMACSKTLGDRVECCVAVGGAEQVAVGEAGKFVGAVADAAVLLGAVDVDRRGSAWALTPKRL